MTSPVAHSIFAGTLNSSSIVSSTGSVALGSSHEEHIKTATARAARIDKILFMIYDYGALNFNLAKIRKIFFIFHIKVHKNDKICYPMAISAKMSVFFRWQIICYLCTLSGKDSRTDKYADNTYDCCNFGITVWKDNI